MELDFKAIQEAADHHAAESEQAVKDRIRAMQKKKEERQVKLSFLLTEAAKRKTNKSGGR